MSVIDIRTHAVVAPVLEATLGFAEQDGPEPDSIRLEQLAAHRWRVVDRRLPTGDPFRVLAFIEYCDDWYELTQLGRAVEQHLFAGLEGCLVHVSETATVLAQARLRGGADWPSLQAPAHRCPDGCRAPLVAVVDQGDPAPAARTRSPSRARARRPRT